MPCKAFLCPETGRTISFADAPEYFENLKIELGPRDAPRDSEGLMPAEDIAALVHDIVSDPHAKMSGRYLSPSQLFPGNCCRRQQFIERFIDYDVDPRQLWDAMVGTMYHQHRYRNGTGLGFLLEQRVPEDMRPILGPAGELPDEFKVCEDGLLRVEVFPGVWLCGTVDRASEDWEVLADHKNNKWPTTFARNGHVPTDYGEKSNWGSGSRWEEWPIQLSIYAHIIEAVRHAQGHADFEVKELWIWRTYKQTQHRGYTFRKIPIEKWSKQRLWTLLEEHVTQALEWFRRGADAHDNGDQDGVLKVLEDVPLDGRDKGMFNKQKCSKYCSVQHVCELHAGGGFEF